MASSLEPTIGIGAHRFTVPIQSISVDRQLMNDVATPAMTGSPVVTLSGKSVVGIEIKLSLSPREAMSFLPPIVAYLRTSPFVPVYNEYIAEKLHGCSLVHHGTTPCALVKLQASTNDEPSGIDCILNFLLCNHQMHSYQVTNSPLMEAHIISVIQELQLDKCDLVDNDSFIIRHASQTETRQVVFSEVVDLSVQGIYCTLENQVALIPMEGTEFASMQFMGSLMSSAIVTLVRDNSSVRNLQDLIALQNERSLALGSKTLTEFEVGNPVINICGIRNVAAASLGFATNPDGTNSDAIAITLIESKDVRDFGIVKNPRISQGEKVRLILDRLDSYGYISSDRAALLQINAARKARSEAGREAMRRGMHQ